MATCDLEKQQLHKTYDNTPPIIYHISNNSLPNQKTKAAPATKSSYTKHIRCQPIWFSILFLTFLALTMILATASISTNRILDIGNIPYQKLRKISQEFGLTEHPCEDSENEQGDDLFERSLFRSNIVGKHLLDMVKRASSNSSGVPSDLSSIVKPLPSTIDPNIITSTSLSATQSSSATSNPTNDPKSSSSSSLASSGHATTSKSSATATGHASTSHSSATATGHSKSSSSTKDNGGAPTDTTSGYLSAPVSASPTGSVGNGTPADITGGSSTQSGGSNPTSSVGDGNDGNPTGYTNKPSSGGSDVSPTNSAGDGTPNSDESPAPKKGGHKGNSETNDNAGSNSNNDAKTTPVKSPVTRKTYFTTTLSDGAVSTRTSTTVIMAEAEPTSPSGSDKFKGPNGLQTSKAFQKPILSLGPVLGMTWIIVVAFM